MEMEREKSETGSTERGGEGEGTIDEAVGQLILRSILSLHRDV